MGEHSDTRHHHHGHSHSRHASGRALRLALVVLAVCFLVEIVGGILTNSLALVSDAAHLLSDVVAIAVAIFAQWMAAKPASAARSYGYRRVEVLAALLNGFTLLAIAVYIGIEAYHRLKQPSAVLGAQMMVIAAFGLVAQTITAVVLSRAKGESLNVRGAYLHAMTDAVQSVGVVLAGVLILATKWQAIDPLVSLLIGALIVYSGAQIIWEATHVLIEGTPRDMDLSAIVAAMLGVPGVRQVTDLHAWSLTTGYNALSAHVVAEAATGVLDHELLRRQLMRELCDRFSLQHVTLQIERDCEACRISDCGGWLRSTGTGGEKR